jgi:DNA primase
VGLQVPEDDISPQGPRARAAAARQKQATLTDVLEKAADAYRRHLRESPARHWLLQGRGVSGEVAKQLSAWATPPRAGAAWPACFPHYDDPLLEESGLVIVNEKTAASATTASATG